MVFSLTSIHYPHLIPNRILTQALPLTGNIPQTIQHKTLEDSARSPSQSLNCFTNPIRSTVFIMKDAVRCVALATIYLGVLLLLFRPSLTVSAARLMSSRISFGYFFIQFPLRTIEHLSIRNYCLNFSLISSAQSSNNNLRVELIRAVLLNIRTLIDSDCKLSHRKSVISNTHHMVSLMRRTAERT